MSIVLFIFIFSIYTLDNFYIFFVSAFDKINTGEITRFYENEYTKPFYVIFTLFAFKIILVTSKFRYFLVGLILITSMQLIYLDGSRYGFLGFLVLCFHYIKERRYLLFVFIFVFAIVSLNLMFLSREFLRFGELNLDDYTIFNFIALQSIQYMFEFSLLHFAYVIQTSVNFTGVDFLYSITPIPSSFLNIDVDPVEWRVDMYRPYGGQAEMFAISPICNIIFFCILGALLGLKSTAEKKSSIVKAVLLLFACVASFQYHLRFVQWLLYFILLLEILPTIKVSKAPERIKC